MRLSVVIPAHDEEGTIESTLGGLGATLQRESIDYEVVVVDDASTDGTGRILERLAAEDRRIRTLHSAYGGGFGLAVRAGLESFSGDAVAIVMADGSDDPEDLVTYHRLLAQGYDCVFGSRFGRRGRVQGYPLAKLVVNRIANLGLRVLFGHRYNDTTNAFKAYRREVIDTVQPLVSHHFNLTVELPLKAIVRGHSYAITPISWRNRTWGSSKFAFQEMGSRYVLMVLYAFLELHLSRGDYRRAGVDREGRWRAGLPAMVQYTTTSPHHDSDGAMVEPYSSNR
jgi:dolichol-phosphate mannosyltransferase